MAEKHDNQESLLIQRARGGDLDAYSALVDAHRASIIGFLAVRLPMTTDLEDLAQEVFITAYRKIKTYEGDQHFGAYLRGIAKNYVRNYLRKHRPQAVGGNQELEALIQGRIEGRGWGHEPEVFARLDECLAKMTPRSREMIDLRYYVGHSIAELAEALSRSTGAVKMHLMRARRTLADCLALLGQQRDSTYGTER